MNSPDSRRNEAEPPPPAPGPAEAHRPGFEASPFGIIHYGQDGSIILADAKAAQVRFEAALAGTADPMLVTDAQGRFIAFNDAWADYCRFGTRDACPGTSEAFHGPYDFLLPSGEPVPVGQGVIARALRGERGAKVELVVRHRASGATCFSSYSFGPVLDEHGAVAGAVITVRDITERNRAQDALKRNQAMLARTERAVHLGSWDWDVDTDTVTWSDELFNVLQIDPAHGAPPFAEQDRIYPPEDMARLQRAVARAVAEGTPYDLELKVVRKDGEVRMCAARGNPERAADGKVHRVHGWLQDITERKQVETALRESEEQYRMLFESAFMGVSLHEIILDAQGRPCDYRFLRVNPTAAQWLGRSAAQLLGHTARELFPDRGPEWLMRYSRVVITGEPDHFERFIPASGRHLDFHVYSARPGQFVILTQDITERRRAEVLHADLQEALRAQAAQLRKAQEDERLRISREIHDDLGQLLTALKIEVGGLERKLDQPGLPQALHGLVDRVVRAAELTDTVQAAVQRIAMELRPSLVDQLGLEQALRHEVRQLHERSGLRFALAPEWPFPPVPPGAAGDLFHICREALTNVLRHARAAEVVVGWRREGAAAVFTVADDGIGMGGLDLAATPAVGLTGMRERAALCGGTLSFEPNPPHGTKVTIRIPLDGPGAEGSMER